VAALKEQMSKLEASGNVQEALDTLSALETKLDTFSGEQVEGRK